MWQNNGFGNGPGPPFQNTFNQNDFSSSPFGGGAGTPLAGQQIFAQHQPMQFEDANGEGFAGNNFQPEVGLYNEDAFMQNQFMSPQQQVSFVELGHTNYPVRPIREQC
jgi:YTH domain-containing protein 1